MADHLDAPGLKSPGGAARVDITDVYAFQKPGDANKSILMLNVNPLAPTLANSFMHDAIYELRIDTNGDAAADRSFKILFTEFRNGRQFARVFLNQKRSEDHPQKGHVFLDDAPRTFSGDDEDDDLPESFGRAVIRRAPVSFTATAQVTEQGPYKFFAGIRSDPFFFDLDGFLAGFKFTGSDFFADKNVFGIVLEVPNSALGSNPKIGVWGRTLVHETDRRWFQIDQMGRPAINTVFNHGEDKNTFNRIEPSEDRTTLTVDPNPKAGVTFLESFELTLEALSSPQYSAAQAETIAKILLPDILTYDYSSSAGYLNGRKLTDDVIDISLNLVTNGHIKSDGVGQHTDYLSSFPFLGNPH
jgi:Domain of unknown function (DUF4331)